MRLIYYNFGSLYYFGYLLEGLAQACTKAGVEFKICRHHSPLLNYAAQSSQEKDRIFALGLFQVITNKDKYFFAIDTHDKFYFQTMLPYVKLYFKLNYKLITADQSIIKYAAKIIPIPVTFALRPNDWWHYLPKLPISSELGWGIQEFKRRILLLWHLPTLEDVRQLRYLPPKHDLFFVVPYYSEKVHESINEYRYRVMQILRKESGINAIFGFCGALVGKYREFYHDYLPYKEYLEKIASSRIAIYVRGCYDCLSFKFGYYMALGKPIVGQLIGAKELADCRYPNFDCQFGYEEPESIVLRVRELLESSEKQEHLAATNIDTFEKFFSPEAVGWQILKTLQRT